MKIPVIILLLAAATPVCARETLGIFGDWGAFRDRRGGTVCFAVSAPGASTGKGRSGGQLVVSRWPGQTVGGQLMAGAGTDIQSASLSTGSRSFKLVARGDSAWLADAAGDTLAVAALAGSSRASVDGRTARGNRFSDIYSLQGFSDAWNAARKGCGGS
jgi:predicted small secreted protein